VGCSEHSDKSFECHPFGEFLENMSYYQLFIMTVPYKAVTPLCNEICPRVKVGDFNVFFWVDYRAEIFFCDIT
jgi:hypothetical protein